MQNIQNIGVAAGAAKPQRHRGAEFLKIWVGAGNAPVGRIGVVVGDVCDLGRRAM